MYLHSQSFQGRCLVVAVSMLLASAAHLAHAQTWANNRQGPTLREILTIDATGESGWLWGAEDVAGNGLDNFPQAEQAIDARTVYVDSDANRFYSRVYFSITDNPPGAVTTYVFVDADQSTTTGGSAAAQELEAAFTDDPTDGGYDFVIKTQRTADGATTGAIYQYNTTTRQFGVNPTQPSQIDFESGQFLDPIRINQNVHGYIQSSVDPTLLNLTQACAANIFVRTTTQASNLGDGDLVVGTKTACAPTYTDNIPTVIVTVAQGCTSNAECPNNGLCINGICRVAIPCAVDADCQAEQVCTTDGRCVYQGGNACVNDVDCNGLICRQRVCVVCATDAECGRGLVCASDGRCLNVQGGTATLTSTATSTATSTTASQQGPSLANGEKLQGGACACSTVGAHGRGWLGAAGLFGLLMMLGRSIKRERSR